MMNDQVQPQAMQMMNMNQLQQQQQQPMLSQQQKSQGINQLMNRGGGGGVGGGYGMWPPPPPGLPVDQLKFQNSMLPPPGFVSNSLSKPMGRNNNNKNNWKGKKGNDKRIRKDNVVVGGGSGVVGNVGYKPPTLNELQHQNRLKARRHFPKKKFNNNNGNGNNYNYNRFAPYAHAPRNTTSFIIRAKKAGGITSLVSPCPVTPAVLPTPIFSPSREVLVDMAKEEWGVDGYGSMKGLIRLRSPGNEAEDEDDDEGSSDSDVEEHVEVERRLDHDLSRFEMIYPNSGGGEQSSHYLLENRVDDQDTHIAQLEEENLILKERLFLMEREFDDLRRRLLCLERQNQNVEEVNEEVVENDSENDSGSRDSGRFMEENNEEVGEENNDGSNFVEAKEGQGVEPKETNNSENNVDMPNNAGLEDVSMEENMRVDKEKNEDSVEEKKDNADGHLEGKQGDNDVVVEDKKEIIAEGLPNVEFRDVCMDEQHVQNVVVENRSKDEDVGNEC